MTVVQIVNRLKLTVNYPSKFKEIIKIEKHDKLGRFSVSLLFLSKWKAASRFDLHVCEYSNLFIYMDCKINFKYIYNNKTCILIIK